MKIKSALIAFMLLSVVKFYGQKDSIVNYLDRQFNTTSIKNDVKYIETKVKKEGLWKIVLYYRDGKVYKKAYAKKKKGDNYVGKYLSYHRNGKLAEKSYYNSKNEIHGKIVTFFDNGNRNYTGMYNNGLPDGLWKYYQYNGTLAGKFYYDSKGDIEKYILFDEEGNELKEEVYTKYIKPIFREGREEFSSKMTYLMDNVSYAINTTIYINFVIGVEGEIRDVWVTNNISDKLRVEIKEFFESIKGWSPAVEMNRKIPSKYGIALNFKTRYVAD